MLITEVILENFMSYEYARVNLKPGVNLVVGPNGAGKSSLLLAISVGLGQSYTERSKKLSNLIRWGQDQARVTLILNNSKRGGKRPVPKYDKDQIFLTRILRKDGAYWFELENRAATKQNVQYVLSRFGVDPDNMLIIMHQNMVEQFSVLNTIDKLRMVEAAVGLGPFRENVVLAQQKLARILSQEESVNKLLESAEQTLNYWREQYEKYQQKKQLQTKRRFLARELVWAEVERKEKAVAELETALQKIQKNLREIEDEAKAIQEALQKELERHIQLKAELKILFDERLKLERKISQAETTIALCEKLLRDNSVSEPTAEKLKELVVTCQTQQDHAVIEVKENQIKIQNVDSEIEKLTAKVIDYQIKTALLNYRKESSLVEYEHTSSSVKLAKSSLTEVAAKAQEQGARIAIVKSITDILDEIRITDAHLNALSGISEDIEHQYTFYSKLFLELKEKAQMVSEHRQKALDEVSARMQSWRNVMQSLLDRVNLEYQKILEQTRAVGEVRLSNAQDIENAGLEILVGFKGGKPVPLDSYTQSGGERTTATMSFLLALQQHVRSPFRAVDEYDVHMDPRNREMIAKILINHIKDANAQYIVITPSQVTFAQENANIIAVQNVEGKSAAQEVV
ncbi:MAG: AAA family ATPase [Candidatus Bathyarchaeota archaeon]|nr:AAA family ATPase [Candidatus Bathyarchaeota archaeon]